MIPDTVAFLLAWAALLVVWMLLGLPVGPGAGLYLEAVVGGAPPGGPSVP